MLITGANCPGPGGSPLILLMYPSLMMLATNGILLVLVLKKKEKEKEKTN
jgi:hypothetical protein